MLNPFGLPKINTNPTSDDVAQVLDRRNESRRYMQLNYWDEWEDVYRSSKCLTKKIMVTNKAGQSVLAAACVVTMKAVPGALEAKKKSGRL